MFFFRPGDGGTGRARRRACRVAAGRALSRRCTEPARRLVVGIVFIHHRAARHRDTRRTASSVVARAGRRGRFDGFCSCCEILR